MLENLLVLNAAIAQGTLSCLRRGAGIHTRHARPSVAAPSALLFHHIAIHAASLSALAAGKAYSVGKYLITGYSSRLSVSAAYHLFRL